MPEGRQYTRQFGFLSLKFFRQGQIWCDFHEILSGAVFHTASPISQHAHSTLKKGVILDHPNDGHDHERQPIRVQRGAGRYTKINPVLWGSGHRTPDTPTHPHTPQGSAIQPPSKHIIRTQGSAIQPPSKHTIKTQGSATQPPSTHTHTDHREVLQSHPHL